MLLGLLTRFFLIDDSFSILYILVEWFGDVANEVISVHLNDSGFLFSGLTIAVLEDNSGFLVLLLSSTLNINIVSSLIYVLELVFIKLTQWSELLHILGMLGVLC